MTPVTTADELVPRPAPLTIGILVGVAVAAVAWLVAAPTGPLAPMRVADRLGVPKGWGWGQFLPYAVAVAGTVALVVTAVRDYRRIQAWADEPTVRGGATADEKAKADDWRWQAYRWAKARLPDRHGHDHLQEQVRYGRGILADGIDRRWGKYFAIAFGLLLFAFLAGYSGLKLPAKGTPAASPLYDVFWPLAVVSGGSTAALGVVAVAAYVSRAALAGWRDEMEREAVNEFRLPPGMTVLPAAADPIGVGGDEPPSDPYGLGGGGDEPPPGPDKPEPDYEHAGVDLV